MYAYFGVKGVGWETRDSLRNKRRCASAPLAVVLLAASRERDPSERATRARAQQVLRGVQGALSGRSPAVGAGLSRRPAPPSPGT